MPLIPDFIERLVLLRLNQGPSPLLDFLGAQAFRAACAGVKLGMFEALGAGPLKSAEVACKIKASERGTALLLDALEALGYVKKRAERYGNTAMTAKWLLLKSPTSLAGGIPFFESMVFDRWGHLEESIRRGRPAVFGFEWLDQHPGGYQLYEKGMIAIARTAADEVIAKVKVPSAARRLLDVGGGHGLYSIRFCRRYPGLSATVFDLPLALEVARETIAAEGMGDRVTAQAGDVWRDDLGTGYSVVLLFNIIHAYLPDQKAQLLQKIAGALQPGGLIVIMEQMSGKVLGSAATALARLQALNYFNDLGAQTYTFGDIHGWLKQSSFGNPRRINLIKTPGFSLVLATKDG